MRSKIKWSSLPGGISNGSVRTWVTLLVWCLAEIEEDALHCNRLMSHTYRANAMQAPSSRGWSLWSDGGCMQSDADAGGGPSYRSTAIRKAKLYGPSKIIPAFLVVAHHTAIRGWNRGPSSSCRPGPRAQQNGMERAQINLVVEPLKCAATLRCLRGAWLLRESWEEPSWRAVYHVSSMI